MTSAANLDKYNDDRPNSLAYGPCTLPAVGATESTRAGLSGQRAQLLGADFVFDGGSTGRAEGRSAHGARQRSRQAEGPLGKSTRQACEGIGAPSFHTATVLQCL